MILSPAEERFGGVDEGGGVKSVDVFGRVAGGHVHGVGVGAVEEGVLVAIGAPHGVGEFFENGRASRSSDGKVL
jgi:hypothetical protein